MNNEIKNIYKATECDFKHYLCKSGVACPVSWNILGSVDMKIFLFFFFIIFSFWKAIKIVESAQKK